MTYLDEVLHIFVDDISTKLNIDLSWTLEQRSEKLLDASMQYRDELQSLLTTKSGSHNQNPNRQGNLFEVRDVFINNLNQAISKTYKRYVTADYLYNLKKQGVKLSDSILSAANYNDNVTDVVAFAKGKILDGEKAQYKSIKSFTHLAAERYLENNDKLVVPLEDFEKAKEYWLDRAELGDVIAQAVLEKLVAGQISRRSVSLQGTWIESVIITFSDEEKAKENLQNLADYFLIAESELHQKGHFVTHEVIQHTDISIKQAITYMVGRCVAEIRQAWKDQNIDFSARLQNVINDTKQKFKEIFEEGFLKNLSKSAIDYVFGLIVGFYKNIYQAIQKGGKYFKVVCDEIWLFITGENKSLFQTILNISKAIAALAVTTFIVGLYQYLISIGIPEVFSVVITSFVSALVTVTIFRLIEKAAQITGSVFYTRDVARIRRQEVERICEEVLPLIEEKVAQLDSLIEQEDKERKEIFNKSFVQIKASLNSVEINKIVIAYQELYQYLGHELPFKNENEFDDFMMGNKIFEL